MHIEPQRQLSLTGYSVLELYNEVLRGEPTCRLESRLLRLLTQPHPGRLSDAQLIELRAQLPSIPVVTSDNHFHFPAWPQLLGDLAIRLWEAARESVALISRADEDLLIEAAFLAMEADATIRPTFDQWPDMSKEELRAVLFAAISKLSQIPESLHEQAINSVFH